MFFVYFIGLCLLAWLMYYATGWVVKALGRLNFWFTTIPQEGRFKFSMNEGRVHQTIENVESWSLDDEERFRRIPNRYTFTEKEWGAKWMGLYNTIKVFKDWQWPEYRKDISRDAAGKEIEVHTVVYRKEDVSEWQFQFTYGIWVRGAEVLGNIEADILVLVTIFVLQPKKAFFQNKNWVDVLIGIAQSIVRGYVSDKEFDTVRLLRTDPQMRNDLKTCFLEANGLELGPDGDPDYSTIKTGGTFDTTGVAVWNVNVVQVNAVGAAAEALKAKKINELEGDAAITKAEKDGEARVIAAQKDADALTAKTDARRRYVYETIVEPIQQQPLVAKVLTAEQYSGPDSKIITVVEGGADINPTIPLPSGQPQPPQRGGRP